MNNVPRPQQIYRHFKGNLYQVISLAEHSETGEKLVIYQALYGEFKIYARPLDMFMERVDHEKYPEVKQEYRFEPVDMPEKQEMKNTQENEKQREAQPSGTVRHDDDAAAENDAAAALKGNADDASLNAGEVPAIDPLVLEFLDADSYGERLNILAALHHRITDDMINTMALSVDVEIGEGDIEDRYAELRKCLLLYDKFECTRLR